MSRPVDVHGILERAGADADAPEGSQAWALAQAHAAMADLIKAAHAIADEGCISTSRIKNLRVALANVGSAS